ncbi:MAG TPA: hypothetical protein VHV83_19075 [Armatimonadota bacterium]|nr:hypothetical protein [Armatimonadota bacterium]
MARRLMLAMLLTFFTALFFLPCHAIPSTGPRIGDKVYIVLNMRLTGDYMENHEVAGRKPKGSKHSKVSDHVDITYRCRVMCQVRENTGKQSDALVLTEISRNEQYATGGSGSYEMFDETWGVDEHDKPEFLSRTTAKSNWSYPNVPPKTFISPDVTLSPRDKKYTLTVPNIMPEMFTPKGSTVMTVKTKDNTQNETSPEPGHASTVTSAASMAMMSVYGTGGGQGAGFIRDDGVKNSLTGPWVKPGEPFSITRTTGYHVTEKDFERVSGEEFGDPIDEDGETKTVSLKGNLQLTYTLSYNMEPEELEAIIIPPDNYEKSWLPQGGNDEKTPGNNLTVRVKLQVKGQPGKKPSQGAKFTFKLTDVSQEPGTCLNFPFTSGSSDKDLRIRQEDNKMLEVGGDGQSASSFSDEILDSSLVMQCYDWGAYGKLRVTAELEYGGTLEAHLQDDPSMNYLSIPLDKDSNHVADVWEAEKGTKGKDAKADDENQPKGDGHEGDGLTYYEEYRGIMEGGQHVRCNPIRKDFFISSGLGNEGKQGIMHFRNLTGLEVHEKLTLQELGDNRVINQNSSYKRGSGQHGVILEKDLASDDTSNSEGTGPGTPKHVDKITISFKMLQGTVGVSTLVHELLHACSVYHHGIGDIPSVSWARVPDPDKPGSFFIRESPTIGGIDGGMTVNAAAGYPVKVFDERGNEMTFPHWTVGKEHPMYLAFKQGEHSGYENCVMRYNIAQSYMSEQEKTGGIAIRRIMDEMMNLTEECGLELCSTTEGISFNKKGRDPESRYGSAFAGAGNCAGKICVNDQHDHTPIDAVNNGRHGMVRSDN